MTSVNVGSRTGRIFSSIVRNYLQGFNPEDDLAKGSKDMAKEGRAAAEDAAKEWSD